MAKSWQNKLKNHQVYRSIKEQRGEKLAEYVEQGLKGRRIKKREASRMNQAWDVFGKSDESCEKKSVKTKKGSNNSRWPVCWNHFPELLASLTRATRRSISPRFASYSSFSSLTRFLPWTWIRLFSSASLPRTFRVSSAVDLPLKEKVVAQLQ